MAARVQSMCNFWKNFNLQELQRELDVTASNVASRQDESEASRKRLVQLTRDFKKNTPEEVRQQVAPLVKSFQGEVDSLSKRSKAAESDFLTLYKRLVDLPDPTGVLEQAVLFQKRAQKVSDLEIANKQLRETLEDYNNEFAEVKNQEVTIKHLREQLKDYETRLDARVEARGQEKERELQQAFAERERQLQESQLALATKLEEAQHRIVGLESELEKVQSELFDVKSKYDEATSAKSDEMDMVMAELERATEKAEASEREAEQLRQQLQTVRSSSSSSSSSLLSSEAAVSGGDVMRPTGDVEPGLAVQPPTSLHLELAAKEKEVARLMKNVQELQGSFKKLKEETAAQISRLEEEVKMKNKALAVLEEKLCSQSDYQEIKRELGVLKSVEFSCLEEKGDPEGSSVRGRSLEVLLLEKNKTLESENTQVKVTCAGLTGSPSAESAQPLSSSSSISLLPTTTTTTTKRENQSPHTSAFPQTPEDNHGEEDDVPPQKNSQLSTTTSSAVRSLPDTSTPTLTSRTPTPLPPSMAAAAAAAAAAASFAPMSPFSMLDPRYLQLWQNSPYAMGMSGSMASHFHSAFMPAVGMVKMEPDSSDVLDTAGVAGRVRELLSTHGIGQRVFAKMVLDLSQGTVSELLSKPKPWDKLTEKGRESFRKMDAWTRNPEAVKALKDLSPKKNVTTPAANSQKEKPGTDEKILNLLNQARLEQGLKMAEQKVSSAVVPGGYLADVNGSPSIMTSASHTTTSTSAVSCADNTTKANHRPNHSRKTKREGDLNSACRVADSEQPASGESNEAFVSRIINQVRHEVSSSDDVTHYPKQRKSEESHHRHTGKKQRHVQELSGRQHQHQSVKGSYPSPLLPHNGFSIKLERGDSTSSDSVMDSYSSGPIDLSKPHLSACPSPSTSPLEGSILTGEVTQQTAAALAAWSSMNGEGVDSPHPSNPATPIGGAASVLPDALSPIQRMHSIANSVSSRTQLGMMGCKGLRSSPPSPIQQEHLDKYSDINTEDLVLKVKEKLTEHTISQRVFGEHVLGLSQGSVSDLLARPKPWHLLTQKGKEPFIRMQMFLEDDQAVVRLMASQNRVPQDKLLRSNSRLGTEGGETGSGSSLAQPLPSSPALFPLERHWGYFSPPGSMLEMMALTLEVDTLALTAKVKDVLQFHNLGQKLFGEAVLGLSQGSVSELLSKPKPWPMLSVKGREPFLKMHLWLSEAQNIEQLKGYQTQLKAQRRKKCSSDDQGFDSPVPPKRPRIFFTDEQKETLRAAFRQDPYPNQTTIESLARELGLGMKTVVNWFHNHRMRAKQQHHTGASSDGSSDVGNNGGRSETADDNSNHSDMSSLSGDVASQQAVAALAAAALRQADSCSWMYPKLEPLMQLHNKSSEEWERDSLEDRMDETDGSPGDKQQGENNSSSETVHLSQPPPPPAPPAVVNKRKRSNPQRVCDGVGLDRTKLQKLRVGDSNRGCEDNVQSIDADESFPELNSSPCTVPEQSQPSPSVTAEEVPAHQSSSWDKLKSEREQRISKLQQGLRDSPDWGDEGEEGEEDSAQPLANGVDGQDVKDMSCATPDSSSQMTTGDGEDWPF